jgi:hypothetical protein
VTGCQAAANTIFFLEEIREATEAVRAPSDASAPRTYSTR